MTKPAPTFESIAEKLIDAGIDIHVFLRVLRKLHKKRAKKGQANT